MAAQPKRNRERIRRKALVADSSTTLDLTNVTPHLPLKARGKALWEQHAAEPPFWWTAADISTFVLYCAMTDTLETARKDGTSAAGIAALSKECRQFAGELGLSPTSRGRLRLTEAQSTVAAKKVETMDAKNKRGKAMDVAELVDG